VTPGLWFSSVVSIAIGVGMAGFWTMSLASRSVPEVRAGSREIWFHVTAEMLTAAALVAAGLGTIAAPEAQWSVLLAAAAFGALVYTLIQSPGFYVEHRNPAMLGMFAGFWVVTIPAIVLRFV
jgi:hypothetical protein